jgi:hypothetical protein
MKNKTNRQLKIEIKNEKRKHKGMIKVIAQCDCGCCTEKMYFNDLESANKAFAAAGLVNSATIKDDEGVEHSSIDTFYGFSTSEEEMNRPPLQRLAEKLWKE